MVISIKLSIIMVCFLIILNANQQKTQFPTTVWIYIQDTPQQLNHFRQLNLQNIKKQLQNTTYKLQIITPKTYSQHLANSNSSQQSLKLSQHLKHQYLHKQTITKIYIKLTILYELGGIWLDLSTVLVQNFNWLDTLKNQKYINNRIDGPQVVLFYEPKWLQGTQRRVKDKVEDLVVYPYHYTWFMAAKPKGQFLDRWKELFYQIVGSDFDKSKQIIENFKLDPFQFLVDEQLFQEWLCRAVITIKQSLLDKIHGTQSSNRQLAVSHYKITSIDASKSALLLSSESNYHTHLTMKYLTSQNKNQQNLKFRYLIYLPHEVQLQLLDSLNPTTYKNINHLHSSAIMTCDNTTTIPLKYILKQSIFYQYVIKQDDRNNVPIYEEQYVKHHCNVSSFDVYYQFTVSYLIPLIILAVYVYFVRRVILIFKPECGKRREKRYNQ